MKCFNFKYLLFGNHQKCKIMYGYLPSCSDFSLKNRKNLESSLFQHTVKSCATKVIIHLCCHGAIKNPLLYFPINQSKHSRLLSGRIKQFWVVSNNPFRRKATQRPYHSSDSWPCNWRRSGAFPRAETRNTVISAGVFTKLKGKLKLKVNDCIQLAQVIIRRVKNGQ